MPKKCIPCTTDRSAVWFVCVAILLAAAAFYFASIRQVQQDVRSVEVRPVQPVQPEVRPIYIMPPPTVRPPIRQYNTGIVQQVGLLAGEGGSANAAAPDRTILPLFGRELNIRRGRWNYYTRTDGANPVQVPVRFGNRSCDDDTNGCNEVYDGDSVHVPVLGRSFKASIYKTAF